MPATLLRRVFSAALAASLGACVPHDNPVGVPAAPTPAADVWVTTPDQRLLLAPGVPLPFTAGNDGGLPTIEVDEDLRYQEIAGFGAAVTGSSAWLIRNAMSAPQREGLMRSLFDPGEGIGISLVRLSIGASDFSLADYTYHDLAPGESDPELTRFSIAADRADVIPVVREARAVYPELKVMASPWTAPAWMKSSGRLAGGSLRPDAFAAYAEYFRRYIEAYRAEAIPIYAVSVQNEPRHAAAYPSMVMDPEDQLRFVRDHLGPVLSRAGLPTRILAWDHNWDGSDYPLAVLGDPAARGYLAGVSFHCYAGDVSAQSRVHERFPTEEIHFTECSGGGWAPHFGENLAWNVRHLVIGATRNWARSVLLWNIALDPHGGPTNGGCRDCRGVVTVDPASGMATPNVEYYALGHASKFVRPGARRIGSTSGVAGLESVGFRNPDGGKALVVLNGSEAPTSFRVRARAGAFRYRLDAGAVATFRWR